MLERAEEMRLERMRSELAVLCRGDRWGIDWPKLSRAVANTSKEDLAATVAIVPNSDPDLPQNREGHSIAHMLAARKPGIPSEGVARWTYWRILDACGAAGRLSHRNYKNCTLVHSAAAQHNYIFLEMLREIETSRPSDTVPWNAPGGADWQTPWQKHFRMDAPKTPAAKRTAECLATATGESLPYYLTAESATSSRQDPRWRGQKRAHSRGGRNNYRY